MDVSLILHTSVTHRLKHERHPAPDRAVMFSRVAGSSLIDDQLRALTAGLTRTVDHVHCFGHSHRPKDFVRKGVRYVHNPTATPKERTQNFVPRPMLKLLWGEDGPLPPPEPPIVRFWEGQGMDGHAECV